MLCPFLCSSVKMEKHLTLDVEPASPTGITPLRVCGHHSWPFLWLALHLLQILLYFSPFCHLASPVPFHRLPLANTPFRLHLCISRPSLGGPSDFRQPALGVLAHSHWPGYTEGHGLFSPFLSSVSALPCLVPAPARSLFSHILAYILTYLLFPLNLPLGVLGAVCSSRILIQQSRMVPL